MASLYKKPIVKNDPKTGKVLRSKSKKWWGRYRDALGQEKRTPLAKDKTAAQAMLSEIVRKVELEKAGHADPFEAHAKRPIEEHIQDFEQHLSSKGNTEKYVRETTARVRAVIQDSGCKVIRDISASKIQSHLADCRSSGLAVETSNHYLRAVKNFCRWLMRDRRTPESPVAHLSILNSKSDRRHERRALSSDELRLLVEAAETGRSIESISGADRAMMYVLAAWTGYRKGEIGSLTLQSLQLDADPPTATVSAAYSKRRREDSQILHPDVVMRLRSWIETKQGLKPDAILFPVSGRIPGGVERKTAKMMKLDLAKARSSWLKHAQSEEDLIERTASDFLSYESHDGKFADFHSNRHTFITSLSRNNIPPRMAQSLARHSDIRLTMGTYTHLDLHDQRSAIESLPGFSIERSEITESRHAERRVAGCPPNAREKMVPKMVPSGAENGTIHLAAETYESSSICNESVGEAEDEEDLPNVVSRDSPKQLRCVSPAAARPYSGDETPRKESTPGRTRTSDRRIRNPVLYPAELRAQFRICCVTSFASRFASMLVRSCCVASSAF